MGELNLDVIERYAAQEMCVHYWVIDTSNKPMSKGACKHCGMVKEFYNDWRTALENTNLPPQKPYLRRHI